MDMTQGLYNEDIVGIAQTLARVRGGNSPNYGQLINALAATARLITITELDRIEALAELLRRYPEIGLSMPTMLTTMTEDNRHEPL
jgi:hypothetical protein